MNVDTTEKYEIEELPDGGGRIFRERNDNWMFDSGEEMKQIEQLIQEQEQSDRIHYEECVPKSQRSNTHRTGQFAYSPINQPNFSSQKLHSFPCNQEEYDHIRSGDGLPKIDENFILNIMAEREPKRQKLSEDASKKSSKTAKETLLPLVESTPKRKHPKKKAVTKKSQKPVATKQASKKNGKQQNTGVESILRAMDECSPIQVLIGDSEPEDDLLAGLPMMLQKQPTKAQPSPTREKNQGLGAIVQSTPTPMQKPLATAKKKKAGDVSEVSVDKGDTVENQKEDEKQMDCQKENSVEENPQDERKEDPAQRLEADTAKLNAQKRESEKKINDDALKAVTAALKKQRRDKELLERKANKEQAKLTKLSLQQQKLEIDQERIAIVREQLARRRRKLESEDITKNTNQTTSDPATAMIDDDAEADALLDMWSRVAQCDIPEVVDEEIDVMSHTTDSGTTFPEPNTNYSTFLITLSALKCHEVMTKNPNVEWIQCSDGKVTIDKTKLLAKFVTAMKALNESTPKQYRWSFEKMSFACYCEQPLTLLEIQESITAGHDNLVHAHIVAQYDGSQGRGCRGSHIWDKWMARKEFELPTCTTVYHDGVSLRPLKDGRTSILGYVTLPKKGYVDLDPTTYGAWLIPSSLKMAQYRELKTLQKQSAEPYSFRQYVLNKETEIPDSVGIITMELDSKIKEHDELYHSSRLLWKQKYWEYLPYYQLRRYCMNRFDDDQKWTQFKDHCIATLAERTRGMEWFDFLIEGLQQRCVCFDTEEASTRNTEEEDFVNLEDGDGQDNRRRDDLQHILNGKTEKEVQEVVKDSCLYDSMKRIMKYKCWSEGELQAVPKLARHLFALFTKTRRWLSNRRMNVHLKSPNGDTGKTAILMCIANLFRIPPMQHHLVHTVSNHKFLLNVVRSKLYQIRIMNDLSCDMLTGSQIKSLLESDLQAGNIKQGSITFQELHPPTFITSNLQDRQAFLKSRKEMGGSCQITSDDYQKIFSLEEGRIGSEIELRHPIPKIWQRRYPTCRRCSARFIRWILGIHLLPSKCSKYDPDDFYHDSDRDSENDSRTYTKETSKLKVLKKTLGVRNSSPTHAKRLLHMTEEDLELLEGIKKVKESMNDKAESAITAVTEALNQSKEKAVEDVCPEVHGSES